MLTYFGRIAYIFNRGGGGGWCLLSKSPKNGHGPGFSGKSRSHCKEFHFLSKIGNTEVLFYPFRSLRRNDKRASGAHCFQRAYLPIIGMRLLVGP